MKNKSGLFASGLLCLAIAATLSTGCMGYRLGSTLPSDIKSVYVPPFMNKTAEPELESETTQAAIREFQKDGTLTIETKDRASATLEVTLLKYELAPVRYDQNDIKKANEYRMTITAESVFRKSASGKVLMKTTITGETTLPAGTDLPTAKTAALPAAAQDLGRRIVQAVVETW